MLGVEVKILCKDTWSSILDFQVELLPDSLAPLVQESSRLFLAWEAVRNAKLGPYGSITRVKARTCRLI